MAMQRQVDIEVDSNFNIHTSYHNDIFLLRTRVMVNGENTEITESSYEEPVMSFCHGGTTISTKLCLIANTISPILHKCGVYHVDTFYYKQSPLLHVVFSSESCLKKFLQEIGDVKHVMEVELLYILSEYSKTESPQLLTTIVQLDLFLVSPNRHEAGEAEVHLVTAENCSTFVTHWKESKLFNFASLHWEGTRPPRITTHPKQLKDAVPGETLAFTIQASGTEPLNYQWEIKTGGWSGMWQLCDVERFPGANFSTLIVPHVQRLNEGSYRCVVSNIVGSQTSEPVNLNIAKPPRVIVQPKELKDVVACKPVTFTIEVTGTEPLSYHWQRNVGGASGRWQSCDVETFPGANSHTLTIPSVQKSDEGSYCCVISNIVDSQISESVQLSTAEPPRITVHPHKVKDAIPGKCITLTVQATGTAPLSYQWKLKTGGESERPQICDVERFPGANRSTLTIPSVQKSNEGSYYCIVSNCAGSETSECATLTVAEPPWITAHPQELKDTVSGKPVSFTIQATGTEPLRYQWQWKPVVEGVHSGEWQNLSSGRLVQGADTATLTFTSIESCSEGLYRCVVTSAVGEEISKCADHIIGKITEPRDILNELSRISQWYLLGIYLGLRPSTLDPISADYKTTSECRTQMLIEWQRHVTPTWSAVVKALVGIGRERLASELATKYGISLPDTIDNKPLEEMEITEAKQKMVAGSTGVHFHRDEFQQLARRLSEIEEFLKASRDSQAPLNENVNNLVSELTKLGKELQKLTQEREDTMSELRRKQHDFQLLSEIKSKDVAHSVEKCQLLQEILTDKRKEIKRLEEELQKKEHQLQSVQQEAQTMKDKLSKLQAELEEKHEEVKNLQKEKKKLTKLSNAEKEEIKKLVQIISSDRDELKQQLIATKEELKHKSQQVAVCNSQISQLMEDIEALSSSLVEKEATVAQLETELPSHQKDASNPKQLSAVILLTADIAELKQKLQEAEIQKQQNILEREAAVQEMEAKKDEEIQLHRHLDEPPKVIDHPKSLKGVVPGKPVTFTILANGTEPLSYQWELKTGGETQEWGSCDMERFLGAKSSTLTILTVQKSNEGSYRCTVNNLAGSGTSECATLTVAEPPRITSHPPEQKDAVPGKPVAFSIQATGTEPLKYQWQYKIGEENGEWQSRVVESFPGANSPKLTIPSVQKSNEGSYCCTVRNCAGIQTSECARLTVAEPPRITTHPKGIVNASPGKLVVFSIQTTGTEPLRYLWECRRESGNTAWQSCDVEVANSSTLIFSTVHKSNEGSYHCIVSNCAGTETSECATLTLADPPTIITHPQAVEDVVPGKVVTFSIEAAGTEPLSYQWQHRKGWEGAKWQLCDTKSSGSATLTISSVQKPNEGSYCCVVSNCAGSQTSEPVELSFAVPPRIVTHPQEIKATYGTSVTLTVEVVGTEPLSYMWQLKTGGWIGWWQSCDVESFPGATTPTLLIPSVQKSNEGSYRCVISNCVGSQTSKAAKLETHPLSELTWRRLPDMPRAMVFPQSVTVDTAVYIAERYGSRVILRYDPHSNKFTQLPLYQYCYFTMTELTHQLVMVGGVDVSTRKTTNTVAVYSSSQRRWTHPYPPMNTPRSYPAVATYQQHLVVAGGSDDSGTYIATVEILDMTLQQWLSASGLPVSGSRMSAAITHGTLYLLGGSLGKQVLSVSLSALTQTDKPPAQWRTFSDAPLKDSTAIAVHGSLLAVGGSHIRQRSSAIHVYNQEKSVWNKVGDLPAERTYCACSLLPSGEILVAGGQDGNDWTIRMDAAAVKN